MLNNQYLIRKDITEDVVIIKINQTYDPHMSALNLYDYTRGCWKRRIESAMLPSSTEKQFPIIRRGIVTESDSLELLRLKKFEISILGNR